MCPGILPICPLPLSWPLTAPTRNRERVCDTVRTFSRKKWESSWFGNPPVPPVYLSRKTDFSYFCDLAETLTVSFEKLFRGFEVLGVLWGEFRTRSLERGQVFTQLELVDFRFAASSNPLKTCLIEGARPILRWLQTQNRIVSGSAKRRGRQMQCDDDQ